MCILRVLREHDQWVVYYHVTCMYTYTCAITIYKFVCMYPTFRKYTQFVVEYPIRM